MKTQMDFVGNIKIDFLDLINSLEIYFGKPIGYNKDLDSKCFRNIYEGYNSDKEYKDIKQMTQKEYKAMYLIEELKKIYKSK